MLVLGFLPVANWLPGGHEADFYSSVSAEWVSGTLIVLGVAAVGVIIARRITIWPEGVWNRAAWIADDKRVEFGLCLVAFSFAIYTTIARTIFSAKPLLIDEIVQVMQARIFASGSIALTTPPQPEFFSALHVVDFNGRTFSQFPPGGPLMLLPGVLLGAPWLVGPVFGALAAGVYWHLVRRIEPQKTVALGAALLFALAPFTAFMAGSHMNHVPTLFWLCLALLCLQHLTDSDGRFHGLAFSCGLCFGLMATIRPADALAFALPAGVWLLIRAMRRRGSWADVILAGAGILIPVAGMLAFNAATTGKPFLFGYELLWGKSHALGFHRAPWGVTHTPARGVELVNLYFLRLQTYLFETPVPSLLPCIAAMLLTRSLREFDRYLLCGSALLIGSYFAYWHDGFFLGPRFFYLLIPSLALWTARLPALVRERWPQRRDAHRFVLLSFAASVLIALFASIPVRARQYAGGLTSMRHEYTEPAKQAGIHDALIFVRESWGAQVIARLWALGIPHSDTETLYRGVDTCQLEEAVTQLEHEHAGSASALTALRTLLQDSLRVRKSKLSPDETERVVPGRRYAAVCGRRIMEDRAGYTFLAPILATAVGSNVYARDLHDRDSVLLRRFAGRSIYLLTPKSAALGAALQLVPFDMDSARMEWPLDASALNRVW